MGKEKGKILILGEQKQDCACVRDEIIGSGEDSSGYDKNGNDCVEWNVATKYYTAAIDVEIVVASVEHAHQVREVEAVVGVIDPFDSSSLERMLAFIKDCGYKEGSEEERGEEEQNLYQGLKEQKPPGLKCRVATFILEPYSRKSIRTHLCRS